MVALLFSNASQVALIDLNASNYKICLMAMIPRCDDDDDDDDEDDDDDVVEKIAVQRKEALEPCEELDIRLLCALLRSPLSLLILNRM